MIAPRLARPPAGHVTKTRTLTDPPGAPPAVPPRSTPVTTSLAHPAPGPWPPPSPSPRSSLQKITASTPGTPGLQTSRLVVRRIFPTSSRTDGRPDDMSPGTQVARTFPPFHPILAGSAGSHGSSWPYQYTFRGENTLQPLNFSETCVKMAPSRHRRTWAPTAQWPQPSRAQAPGAMSFPDHRAFHPGFPARPEASPRLVHFRHDCRNLDSGG